MSEGAIIFETVATFAVIVYIYVDHGTVYLSNDDQIMWRAL